MDPKRFRIAPRRLAVCLSSATLAAAVGCATAPASSPLPAPTMATNANPSGPVLGYAWDRSAAGLRQILGVPGAAMLSAPAYVGANYTNAGVCPQKGYALLTGAAGQTFVALLPSGTPSQVAPSLSPKESIILSPACSAALLYAPGSSTAYVVLGLPAAPKAQELDLSQAGQVTAAAVSDAGLVLTASVQTGGGLTVQTISSSGTASRIASLMGFGGMTFLPSSQNALIADSGVNVVWLTKNLNAGVVLNRAASGADGVTQPVAIATSFDGRWLVVANQSGSAILRVDLSGQTKPAQIACDCTVTALAPLQGNSTFLLSRLTAGPLWTFDGDASTPRILFLPGITPVKTAGVAQ